MAQQGSRSETAAPAIAVVGASAGGVEALCEFVSGLPADLEQAVLAVLHLAPYSASVLDKILARNTALPVVRPVDGEPVLAGHVYVAPPDRHLVVRDHSLRLSTSPTENGHRPAINPALRSAIGAYGAATAGVLLSGTGDDGTAGLIAVQHAGGATAVQDPEEALYDRMARSAMRHLAVDAVLPASQIGLWLCELPAVRGAATRFTCPDCGGVLFAVEDGGLQQFRCSIGHKYSPDSLMFGG